MTAPKRGSREWCLRERKRLLEDIDLYSEVLEDLEELPDVPEKYPAVEAITGKLEESKTDLKLLRTDWHEYSKRYEQ